MSSAEINEEMVCWAYENESHGPGGSFSKRRKRMRVHTLSDQERSRTEGTNVDTRDLRYIQDHTYVQCVYGHTQRCIWYWSAPCTTTTTYIHESKEVAKSNFQVNSYGIVPFPTVNTVRVHTHSIYGESRYIPTVNTVNANSAGRPSVEGSHRRCR